MFQKYYSTNITTNFIKNLLSSTYIPDVPVWKPGKPIINNGFYITQDYILKAVNSFIPNSGYEGPTNQLDANFFDVVDRYLENSYNHGYCNKYNSSTSYYDSKTHYYLGQYLRLQRDMYNLDLMAYYNCWCGEYSDKIRINQTTFNITDKNIENDGLKVLLVPIKYNQRYTIYINSNSSIIMQPVLIANNKIISGIEDKTKFKSNTKYLYSSNFYNPYVYEGLQFSTYSSSQLANINKNLSSELEKYLYLAIQVSELVSSHIVILEGDYSKNKLFSFGDFGYNTSSITNKLLKTYFGKPNPNQPTIYSLQDEVNKYCRISPGLIRTIDNSSYAFDDRLLEYLLLNVIDNKDEISDNIKRVQDYITSSDNLLKNKIRTYNINNSEINFNTKQYPLSLTTYSNYLPGVWDNQMRMYLYDLITQHWKTPKTVDISGYVDKDVESILGDND